MRGGIAAVVVGMVAAQALCWMAGSATAATLHRIDLVPLGAALPEADVTAVRDGLRAIYGVEVGVREPMPLPRSAWYAARKRWRAEKILDWMATLPMGEADHLLALTAADISTTKGRVFDWGVLGLGNLDGRFGVLSRFRCGRHVSVEQSRERLAKVAVHELGHTLGLDHCPVRGCLMEDAEGKVATTDEERDLCPRCRHLLAQHGFVLPADPHPPWR